MRPLPLDDMRVHSERTGRAPEHHPLLTLTSESAFTATIKLAELRADTLAKRRPWYYYSVAWDTSVHNTGRLDTRPPAGAHTRAPR